MKDYPAQATKTAKELLYSALTRQHKAILAFDELCRANYVTGFYLGKNISPNSCVSAPKNDLKKGKKENNCHL